MCDDLYLDLIRECDRSDNYNTSITLFREARYRRLSLASLLYYIFTTCRGGGGGVLSQYYVLYKNPKPKNGHVPEETEDRPRPITPIIHHRLDLNLNESE